MARITLPDFILAENQRIADEIGARYEADLRRAFGLPEKREPTAGTAGPEETADGGEGGGT